MDDQLVDEQLTTGRIKVEVVYALPHKQVLLSVELAAGSTVMDAIEQSGIRSRFSDLEIDSKSLGVFSQRARPDRVLENGDRVEIYRPLLVGPKEARRLRAEADKERKKS